MFLKTSTKWEEDDFRVGHNHCIETNFHVSPMQMFGLPSFAQEAMFKLYDRNCPSIFTFPKNSDATKVFREQVIGGLCNVYKRHCTLLDEEAAPKARYNVDGK